MSGAEEAIRRAKTTAPWTPGPWHARGSESLPGGWVHDANGEFVCGNLGLSDADARLIASAPEMVALLDEIAAYWNDERPIDLYQSKVPAAVNELVGRIRGGA